MAVIVYQYQRVDGVNLRVGRFLPQDKHLDEHMVRQAEGLDRELSEKVEAINKRFHKLKSVNQKVLSNTDKWIWLGKEVGKLLRGLKHLDDSDIYNNIIWPAINQYLDDDLKKYSNPEIGGGAKDHLRRCYYFVQYDFHKFMPSWGAWYELTSRGDQLIQSKIFRDALRDTFGRDKDSLTVNDYVGISKLLAEQWPSNTRERVIIEHVDPEKIRRDMKKIYKKWISSKP